ncbi:hypothetical protein BN1058_01185 [Paraliobacillus sp. PM-2]|uniref:hypothetical protein n=1 Tax=Paraliobacillus sp. PM-2 TaxID=1462524 RepID=UPI00061BEA22|nr:hypothetical protein [Paraliobacillus sp. PM-2]CQR46901.1 hypothetical protein BN1058_01185 [Paraliobacillus sp. PM-2]
MKMLVYMLLIAVVFLTGMLFGTKNNQMMVQESNQQIIESRDEEQKAVSVTIDREQQSNVNQNRIAQQKSFSDNKPLIEKVAIFIETTSVWAYDQVIQAAYHISEIFV